MVKSNKFRTFASQLKKEIMRTYDRTILILLGFGLIGHGLKGDASDLWILAGSCIIALACR